MGTAKVFIDESGNSGAEIYDPNQPVYSVACVCIDETACEQMAELVDRIRSANRVQMPELKGKALARSSRGRRTIEELGRGCVELGARIMMAAQHKPFMAASVVVEDCTDHLYNKEFTPQWTWDTRLKEPLAAAIHVGIDAPQLMHWWRARRSESLAEFERAHEELISAMAANPELAEFAVKFRDTNLRGGWEPESVRKEFPTGGYSPNSIMFPPVLMGLEAMAEAVGLERVHIVHDEQPEFEEGYSFLLEMYQNSQPFEFALPNGNTVRAPVRSLESIEFRSSKEEKGLQIADCMAVVARLTVQSVTHPSAISTNKTPFSAFLSECLTDHVGNWPWVVGPQGWQVKAMSALLGFA